MSRHRGGMLLFLGIAMGMNGCMDYRPGATLGTPPPRTQQYDLSVPTFPAATPKLETTPPLKDSSTAPAVTQSTAPASTQKQGTAPASTQKQNTAPGATPPKATAPASPPKQDTSPAATPKKDTAPTSTRPG